MTAAAIDLREPVPLYLDRSQGVLLRGLDIGAIASNGVAKLREVTLILAMQGQLIPQSVADQAVDLLLEQAKLAKGEASKSGRRKFAPPATRVNTEEQPFSIPASWRWVRIGDVCSYIQRGKGPDYAEASAVPVVSQKCVRWSGLDLSRARFITPASLGAYDEERFLRAGDVLWNSTGTGTIGRAVVVPRQTEFPMLVADSHVTVVRPVGIASDFLWRWIQSPYVQAEIERSASGSTNQIELATATVVAHPLPLPPLAEQHRIVARVEELMKLCDALEQSGRLADEQHARLTSTLFDALAASESAHALAENWQRVAEHFDLLLDRVEATDTFEQAVLQLAVRGALVAQDPRESNSAGTPTNQRLAESNVDDVEEADSKLPASWRRTTLGEVTRDLRYGTSAKCAYDVKGVPVLRIPNLNKGRVLVTDLKFGSLGADEADRLRLEVGDLLIIRSNGSASLVGSAAIVGQEAKGFAFAGYLMRLRVRADAVLPSYVLLVLGTTNVRNQIEGPLRTTSGVKNINSTEVARIRLPLPPLGEQHRIVARVEELRRLCADLRLRLTQAREVQSRLADALVAEVA